MRRAGVWGDKNRVSKKFDMVTHKIFFFQPEFSQSESYVQGPSPSAQGLAEEHLQSRESLRVFWTINSSTIIQFDYCLTASLQMHTNSVVSLKEFEIYKAKGESTSTGHKRG